MKSAIIDIDDTICQLIPELINVWYCMTGKFVKVEDWITYNMWDMYDISPDDYFKHCRELSIMERALPVEGASETIHRLSEFYYVTYLTARGWHENAHNLTLKWLEKWGFPPCDLHVIPLHAPKHEYIKYEFPNVNREESIFIDDNPKHVKGVVENGIIDKVFLIDAPWNNQYPELDQYRIKDVNHVVDKLF